MMQKLKILTAIGLCLAIGLLFFLAPAAASRGAVAPEFQQATPNANLSLADEYCLSCHSSPGQAITLEDGSTLDLYVDPQEHASSIHGEQGYACVQCHTDVGEYPHPPFTAIDRRDVTLKLNVVCEYCHTGEHIKSMDSVHAKAQAAGNREAAVCTDCHTAHAVQKWVDDTTGETLPEMRAEIPTTCAKCHSAIFGKYATSVHGSALTDENNPDVPTCIDCHGVHDIEDPTTAAFRLASPQMCANCHTDSERMAKYGISTDVLESYVADFHGTTVEIFEKQSPDAETNKPVCYDCHGIHDIMRADDPEKGLQVKENLLVTCQKCHPNAAENFPTAWLSHYTPSPEKYPIVYYVNLFYLLFIPVVLGGMALLVVMDISRASVDRRRAKNYAQAQLDQSNGDTLEQQANEEEAPIVAEPATRSETDYQGEETIAPQDVNDPDEEEAANG
jgi:hypothetical protein